MGFPEIKATALRNVPTDLMFDGEFELAAKAATEEGDTPTKFVLSANSGKPMQLEEFLDPVVIDLAGAKFDKRTTPVIADHDTTKRIGHTLEQVVIPAGGEANLNGKAVRGPLIAALGQVSSKMGIAQGFVEDARAGFPFQVSVGAKMLDGYFVEAGDKAEVNGKTFKGPLIVATKTLIRELTVTVLGADNNTSAKLAAIATRNNNPERSKDMDFAAFVRSLGLDPTTIEAGSEQEQNLKAAWKAQQEPNDPPATPPATPPIQAGNTGNDIEAADRERRQRIAQEETRVDAIRATATRFDGNVPEQIEVDGKKYTLPQLKAHAINEGWNADQFELTLLRVERPASSGPAIHASDNNVEGEALQAAIMRQFGLAPNRATNPISGREYGLECMFSEQALEASHGRQYQFGGSLQALLDMQIRAAGMYYPSSDRKSGDFVATAVKAWETIKASGFSTLSITNVLENTMHKTALASFEGVESVWRFITGRRSLSDFRPHNLYRLTEDGSYRQVARDGELKHISMTDTKYSISADTFGAMITIDRQTMKNDDLGLVLDKARALGQLGGQRIEESVFVLLLSNPGSFFSAGNGNLLTGAGSALSVTSLNDARQSFRDQVDSNGKPIGISPRILLVPTTLETTANRLWAEERLEATGNTDQTVFVNNPHRGLYRPYITPYLNNTNITDQDGNAYSGQSDTQWYLFADPNAPQGAAISIGFVDGRDTPYFDEAETQFNVPGGMQFRSYLDWGVAMHVTEMALKSAGA